MKLFVTSVSFLAPTLLASSLECLEGLDFANLKRDYASCSNSLASTSNDLTVKVQSLNTLFDIFNRDFENNLRNASGNRPLEETIADKLAPIYDFDGAVVLRWFEVILLELRQQKALLEEIPSLSSDSNNLPMKS